MSHVDLKEFISGFVMEADEHLDSVSRNLVAVSEASKQGKREPRAIRGLFRSFHTIKGLAAMVQAQPIVDIAHEMEGILRISDQSGGGLRETALNLLLQGTRAVEERIRVLSKEGLAAIPAAPTKLLEALVNAQSGTVPFQAAETIELELPTDIDKNLSASEREQILAAAKGGWRIVLVDFQPSAEKNAAGINITTLRERLGRVGEIVKVAPRVLPSAPTGIAFTLIVTTKQTSQNLVEAMGSAEAIEEIAFVRKAAVVAPLPDVGRWTESSGDDWNSKDHSSVRVDVRRLDEALERLSPLLITRSKLARLAQSLKAQGADTRELSGVISDYARQLKRLRSAITDARMVPLSELLQRLPLVVRGLTQGSEKSVNLTVQASSAEVDKAVADKIFPAIVHLVRNAVDHAIESRVDRVRKNKPEAGQLTIVCDDSSGTNLVLRVIDDGRGIDREAVARKTGKAAADTAEELLEQICVPGFSTKDDVTHTSGRGMGMDIVKRTIESLGGMVSLQSTPDNGTTFTLRVPVSVTIVDVLSFISGEQVFVVPIAMVEEIIEVDPGLLSKVPELRKGGAQPRLIQRRDQAIPLLVLDGVLHRKEVAEIPTKALVVHQQRGLIAFAVDRMLGQQEVVIRPLVDDLIKIPGVSGAADLGDGKPTLVLDLVTMGNAALQRSVAV